MKNMVLVIIGLFALSACGKLEEEKLPQQKQELGGISVGNPGSEMTAYKSDFGYKIQFNKALTLDKSENERFVMISNSEILVGNESLSYITFEVLQSPDDPKVTRIIRDFDELKDYVEEKLPKLEFEEAKDDAGNSALISQSVVEGESHDIDYFVLTEQFLVLQVTQRAIAEAQGLDLIPPVFENLGFQQTREIPELKADPKPEPDPRPQPQPQPDPEPAPEPDPVVDPQPEPEPTDSFEFSIALENPVNQRVLLNKNAQVKWVPRAMITRIMRASRDDRTAQAQLNRLFDRFRWVSAKVALEDSESLEFIHQSESALESELRSQGGPQIYWMVGYKLKAESARTQEVNIEYTLQVNMVDGHLFKQTSQEGFGPSKRMRNAVYFLVE